MFKVEQIKRLVRYIENIRIRIVLNLSKVLMMYIKIKKEYLLILCIIQVGLILLLGYIWVGEDLFFQKLIGVVNISIIILIYRWFCRTILIWAGWDKKEDTISEDKKKIKEFFIQHKFINKLCYIWDKYINVWRIILIIRNKVLIGMRYIRYIIYRRKKIEEWKKIEKIIVYIMKEWVLLYIIIIIEDIYTPVKKALIVRKIKEILIGNLEIQIILLLGIVKGVNWVIVCILLYKGIECLWLGLQNVLGILDSESRFWLSSSCNLWMENNSYILKHIKKKDTDYYIGDNKVVPRKIEYWTRGDSWYPCEYLKELRYYEIAGGPKWNEIGEFGEILDGVWAQTFLEVEYLEDKILQNKGIGKKKDKKVVSNMVKIKKEWIRSIKKVQKKIKQHNIELQIYIQWTAVNLRLVIKVDWKLELVKVKSMWEKKSIENELKQLVVIEQMIYKDKEWARYIEEWNEYEMEVQKSMYKEYCEIKKEGDVAVEELRKKWTKEYLLHWFIISKNNVGVSGTKKRKF